VASSSSVGKAITDRGMFMFIVGGQLVVKWDLDNERAMEGKPTRRLLDLIRELKTEGLL
jgi:hypothetical protein